MGLLTLSQAARRLATATDVASYPDDDQEPHDEGPAFSPREPGT